MRRFLFLAFLSLILTAGCQKSPLDFTAKSEQNGEIRREDFNAPPFATKEPQKYQARIVFIFKAEETGENTLEQTNFVARDGAYRRLDFEIGGKLISRLETADGKQIILLTKQKVYAEIAALDENFIKNAPAESSLEYLLYAKPFGAKFEKIGAEEIGGRQTTKYRIIFDRINQNENVGTETLIWADENLSLPVKTEIVALIDGKPNGAKSIVELREIKLEVDSQIFAVPADYRKISAGEMREIIRPK
jgi:hypothetical protein